jgi:hypothetical protein
VTATVANYWASLTKIGDSLTITKGSIVLGTNKMTGRRKSERNAVKRLSHVNENETPDDKQKQVKKQVPIYLRTYLSIYLPTDLSIHPPTYVPTSLYVYQPFFQSIRLPPSLPASPHSSSYEPATGWVHFSADDRQPGRFVYWLVGSLVLGSVLGRDTVYHDSIL